MSRSLSTQQLESLSLKLEEMNNARGTLLAQLADLDAAIRIVRAECKTVLRNSSAIARIPNEILAMIFEEAHSCRNGAGLPLSQVTHRWRDVAINTPRLWSRIDVEVRGPRRVNLVALYLSRLKALPFDLKLTIEERLRDKDRDHRIHGAVLGKLLGDHIHRCRRLDLELHSADSAGAILDFLAVASAPLLQSFDATYYYGYGGHDIQPILKGGTPMLTNMRLIGAPSHLPPLCNVVTFHLDMDDDRMPYSYIDTQNLKGPLSSLTHLVFLEITIVLWGRWRGPAVTLPALQTLRLVDRDGGLIGRIYEAIDAPLLEFLSLQSFVAEETLDWLHHASDLAPTKFPRLHTLSFADSEMALEFLLEPFMRTFPHLETVKFKWQSRDQFRQVLQLLLETDAPGPYWPRLRHLASDFPRFNRHNDTHELLASVLRHRITTGRPVETLTVSKEVIAGVLRSAPAWTKLIEMVEYELDDNAFEYINYTDNEEVEDDSDMDI